MIMWWMSKFLWIIRKAAIQIKNRNEKKDKDKKKVTFFSLISLVYIHLDEGKSHPYQP